MGYVKFFKGMLLFFASQLVLWAGLHGGIHQASGRLLAYSLLDTTVFTLTWTWVTARYRPILPLMLFTFACWTVFVIVAIRFALLDHVFTSGLIAVPPTSAIVALAMALAGGIMLGHQVIELHRRSRERNQS